MACWLFKTEPDTYSIDDLKREKTTHWDGIRNYQARNRLRDEIKPGDQVLIYHSSCKQPAVVGLAEITRGAHPDPSQFDPQSSGHDAKSDPGNPRWVQVSLRFRQKFAREVSLREIRQDKTLQDMELLHRPRLSVQQVSPGELDHIINLATQERP